MKITGLPNTTAVKDTDIIPIVQDGETKQIKRQLFVQASLDIDDTISDTSEHIVQNKAIKKYVDASVTPKNLSFFTSGKNIFDKNALLAGKALATNGKNALVDVESMSATEEIPVASATSYFVSVQGTGINNSFRSLEIHSDGTCTYKTISVGPSGYLWATADNTVAVRVSGTTAAISNMQIEKGTVKTAYEAYTQFIPSAYLDPNLLSARLANPLYGKKAVFNGDSILELPYGWHKDLCDYFGMTCVNYAIGGSTLTNYAGDGTPQKTRDPLIDRYTVMDTDADIVFISIGTNDWWYTWCPLGSDTDTATTTFRGALHTMIRGLLDMYPQKVIVFVTPIKRGADPKHKNGNGNTLEDFADAILDVCGQYGIPTLDMFRTCPLNPSIASQQALYFDGSKNDALGYANLYNDTTHPNVYGAKVQARTAIGFVKSIC